MEEGENSTKNHPTKILVFGWVHLKKPVPAVINILTSCQIQVSLKAIAFSIPVGTKGTHFYYFSHCFSIAFSSSSSFFICQLIFPNNYWELKIAWGQPSRSSLSKMLHYVLKSSLYKDKHYSK